jgi:hypothetical protein
MLSITVKLIEEWLININNGEINDHHNHHIVYKAKKGNALKDAFNFINSNFIDVAEHREVKLEMRYQDQNILQTGVPQGSIYTPLLFTFHINDMSICFENSSSDLYTHDSTLYAYGYGA